ncbi:MAG: VWA domain-containing protein [Thermoanaerobaculia bacterium]
MSGRALGAIGVLGGALVVAAAAAGLQEAPAPAPAAAKPEVTIVSPQSHEPLFGEVELEAEITNASVASVEFIVDGALLGSLTAPPWKMTVDVGHENVEHRLRVVARLTNGTAIEKVLRSGTFTVDDVLDIELRQLYVSVSSGGRALLNLDQNAFRVIDDGVEQDIVTFGRGDVPLTAVLLLDCSESMAGDRLQAALDGSRVFLRGMNDLDEVKVVLFSDRIVRTTPFATDTGVLEAALDGISPVGGTAVNDYLYSGLQLLDARQGRKVVVLFTDGVDVHSLLPAKDVLWKAQRSQAVIYWIYLKEDNSAIAAGDSEATFNSAWRDYKANEREFATLAKIVEQSGGRIEELDSARQLQGAFADIIRELREHYVLGYYPKQVRHDGSWHDLEVRVQGPGRVRTREGYVDD